jgi:hypothetical protein
VSQAVINLAREAAKREILRPIIFCAEESGQDHLLLLRGTGKKGAGIAQTR